MGLVPLIIAVLAEIVIIIVMELFSYIVTVTEGADHGRLLVSKV